jgi:hypothetical protein
MKIRPQKDHASKLVFIIPLAAAFMTIIAAAVFGTLSTDIRSRASYNGVAQCTKACNTTGKNAAFITDKAACALDCPAVVAGEMACTQFCRENVRGAGTVTNKRGEERDWSAGGVCMQQCNQWVADPCSSKGAVCKFAMGKNAGEAKSQCASACTSVKSGEKSCEAAFSGAAVKGVNNQIVPALLSSCKKYFGNQTPSGTPPASGTPSPTSAAAFSCADKCDGVPSAYKPTCMSMCTQFNNGTRTCPTGCSMANSQMQSTCTQLFCSGQ